MALMAWYPLINNMMNQGVGDADLRTTETPVFGEGLIGGALVSGGKSYWTAQQTAKILNNNAFSIAFWLYVNDETGSNSFANTAESVLFGNDSMGENNNRKFSLFQYRNCNSLHWSWMNDEKDKTFTNGTIANCLPSYKWTHVAVTYNNPDVNIYVNGELIHKSSGVSNSSSFSYDTIVIHSSSRRKLCDYRVYNHCITEKEVAELAKGLVIHYPLSISGQYNLVSYSHDYSGWGHSTEVNILDGNTTKVLDYQPSTSKWLSAYHPRMDFSIVRFKTITASCYVKAEQGEKCGINFNFSLFSSKDSGRAKYKDNFIEYTGTGDWQLLYHTFIASDDYFSLSSGSIDYENCLFGFLLYNWPTKYGNAFQAKELKLEFGDKPTPWMPNSTDSIYTALGYDNNIIYDVSGYSHNGTLIGNTSYSSETSKYNTSIVFGDGSHVKTPNLSALAFEDSFTISFLAKYSNNSMAFGYSNGNLANLYVSGYYFYWNTGDGSNNPFQDTSGNKISASVYLSAIHHYVITGNGTDVMLYIDGEHIGNAKTYVVPTGTEIYLNGWNNSNKYNINSYMSDFRVYATALSATDVLELYNHVNS